MLTNAKLFPKAVDQSCRPVDQSFIMACFKTTETYCRARLFAEFIQTQINYPIPFDKISIPNF